MQAPRLEPRAPRRRRRPAPRGSRAAEPGAPQPPGSRARRRRAEEAREERSGRSRRGAGPRTQFMAGTRSRRASGPRRPGSAGPHGARRGGRGWPLRRLARAPSCAAAASTPRRCPAEQPLKPRQPPRSERRGRGPAPGQWPRRSELRAAPWVSELRAATPGAPGPPCRARRASPAETGPSRRRCASRGARYQCRLPPSRPAPSLARRAPAHVGPASAPPARALAALRPPPPLLRPPRRFPARRIPGNCARLRPAPASGLPGTCSPRRVGALRGQRGGGARRPLPGAQPERGNLGRGIFPPSDLRRDPAPAPALPAGPLRFPAGSFALGPGRHCATPPAAFLFVCKRLARGAFATRQSTPMTICYPTTTALFILFF